MPAARHPTETLTAADTVYAVLSGPATVAEGATTSNYTVTLVNAAGTPVTVTNATAVTVLFANGTAEAGDYVATPQTVSILAGASSATFTVATSEDADFEDETFVASIDSVADTGEFEAINTTTGTAGLLPSVTTTISDNDVPPTISINDVTVNEDAGTMTFTVSPVACHHRSGGLQLRHQQRLRQRRRRLRRHQRLGLDRHRPDDGDLHRGDQR